MYLSPQQIHVPTITLTRHTNCVQYLSRVCLFLLINSELLESAQQHSQHSLVPATNEGIQLSHTHARTHTTRSPLNQPLIHKPPVLHPPLTLLLTLPCPSCLPAHRLTGSYCSALLPWSLILQLLPRRERATQQRGELTIDVYNVYRRDKIMGMQ